MPDVNASPADQHPESNPPAVDEQSRRTFSGLRNLAERITPSLVDVGSWIFGGLIAVNLVVLSALITVGPVDAAIQTSTAALASALPLNVAGIVLLRLIKDVNDVGLDHVKATGQSSRSIDRPLPYAVPVFLAVLTLLAWNWTPGR